MLEGSEPAVRSASFRLTRPETHLLLVLAAVQFTHIVDFMIIMPLGPRMEAGLHLNLEQFSNIVAAYAVSAAVAGLLAAFIMDRFDRKPLVLGALHRLHPRHRPLRLGAELSRCCCWAASSPAPSAASAPRPRSSSSATPSPIRGAAPRWAF